MKIQQLKAKVLRLWKALHSWKGDLMSPPACFGLDIKKQFGDRRYKATWIRALARYEAQMSYESCLDSTLLITTYLNFSPDEPVYEYRHDILEEFLKYPNGLDLIRQGLENLYARDREKAHGFFELVAEREAQRRTDFRLAAA
ncbi:MAG: hypothetical protein AAFU53_01425 [Cyanobacteria bacterium J06632_3]